MQPISALCFGPIISIYDEFVFMSASTSTAIVCLSVSVKSLLKWSLLLFYYYFPHMVESSVLTSTFSSICSYSAGSGWVLQLLGVTRLELCSNLYY